MRDQPVEETSTWLRTTHTRDRHPLPRRDSNPDFPASDQPQTHGQRHRPWIFVFPYFCKIFISLPNDCDYKFVSLHIVISTVLVLISIMYFPFRTKACGHCQHVLSWMWLQIILQCPLYTVYCGCNHLGTACARDRFCSALQYNTSTVV